MATTIIAGNATNGLTLTPDNTGALELKTGTGAGTTALTLDSSQNATVAGTLKAAGVTTAMYPLVSGTAVASTSGTSVDFTGIPSWVKRITVVLTGVSLTTTASTICVRIGSGSFETTGYVGGYGLSNSAAAANAIASTTTIPLATLTAAADTVHGAVVLTNISGNIWVAQGTFFRDSASVDAGFMTASSKTTSGVLDRVQVVLDSTGAFDAGSINILYE